MIARPEAEQQVLIEMEREFEELGRHLNEQQKEQLKTEKIHKNQDIR